MVAHQWAHQSHRLTRHLAASESTLSVGPLRIKGAARRPAGRLDIQGDAGTRGVSWPVPPPPLG